jgi:predicted O-linked N-acetylglucosamine transferase (SPINDLY family)
MPAAGDDQIERAMRAALADHAAGRLDAARAGYQSILSQRPDHARAMHSLGVLEKALGRADLAVELISRAIAIQPDAAEFHNNLGDALLALGRTENAVVALERALQLSPGYVKAYNNLGLARLKQGRTAEAEGALLRAVSYQPNYSKALANLGAVYTQSARHGEALECYRRAVQFDPKYATAHSSMLMLLNYMDLDPADVFRAHREWADRYAAPITAAATPPPRRAIAANQPIRVGFVSGDFTSHAVAGFLLALLHNRDRAALHVTCYSNVQASDEWTAHIRSQADEWRDIVGVADDAAADLIRRDAIDVLIDLAGHSGKSRLLVFARRPAPVQVTWLGYPNTTGMSAMDFRLTDANADPPGVTESLHAEKLVRLRTNWCYTPPPDAPDVVPPPVSTRGDGVVTFGSFNNLAKITPAWLKVWAAILSAVPNARLLIKSNVTGDAGVQERVRSHFVDPSRVTLLGRDADGRAHLDRYAEVDVLLDPFPYHGTTMTCEAMWMGVPVVTMAGRTHASRVGVSLLSSVGLDELITDSREQYVAIARSLAADVPRLVALRQGMRQRMQSSPLLDGAAFARDFERAIRSLFQ